MVLFFVLEVLIYGSAMLIFIQDNLPLRVYDFQRKFKAYNLISFFMLSQFF